MKQGISYKWLLLALLFVTFFLELGTRQAYNALGILGERLSMRAAFASLSLFFLAGALILIPAVFKYFKHDYIGDGK